MATMIESVRQGWEDRDGPAILATVGEEGAPNIVYVTCVAPFGEDRMVVADNYFDKTRRNLLKSGSGSLLFRDSTGKAYQIKGSLDYCTEGEVYDHMKTWNPLQHPGHAAAVLRVEEVFSGAKQLC